MDAPAYAALYAAITWPSAEEEILKLTARLRNDSIVYFLVF